MQTTRRYPKEVRERAVRMVLDHREEYAESVIGLYKTELIRKHGPWKTFADVAFANLEWVGWFNYRRLYETIGNIPRPNGRRSTTLL